MRKLSATHGSNWRSTDDNTLPETDIPSDLSPEESQKELAELKAYGLAVSNEIPEGFKAIWKARLSRVWYLVRHPICRYRAYKAINRIGALITEETEIAHEEWLERREDMKRMANSDPLKGYIFIEEELNSIHIETVDSIKEDAAINSAYLNEVREPK